MSLDVIPKFDLMRNAALIQALESAWPGCGAHNKAGQVVVKPMMAPAINVEIRAYIKGWNASMDWAREQMLSALPFEEPGLRGARAINPPAMNRRAPAPQWKHRSATDAREALESLFSGGSHE